MQNRSTVNKKKKFNKILLKWVKENGRDFFWRYNRDAYKVFVAEFLLKRTTSKAAHRIFLQFLEKYPDLNTLAKSDLCELEKILKPIGLYKQKAKGIKEASEYLVNSCRGKFPKKFDELIKIPHIGNYTAACILSFGMGVSAPAIDSNGQRIISRVFKNSIGNCNTIKKILEFSWGLLPQKDHVLFNYGLIDMGALVCTYRGCSKENCPLKGICDFYKEDS
jgi:A/G-specific adenine glycosylase